MILVPVCYSLEHYLCARKTQAQRPVNKQTNKCKQKVKIELLLLFEETKQFLCYKYYRRSTSFFWRWLQNKPFFFVVLCHRAQRKISRLVPVAIISPPVLRLNVTQEGIVVRVKPPKQPVRRMHSSLQYEISLTHTSGKKVHTHAHTCMQFLQFLSLSSKGPNLNFVLLCSFKSYKYFVLLFT